MMVKGETQLPGSKIGTERCCIMPCYDWNLWEN